MDHTFIQRPGFYFGLLAALLASAVMIGLGDLWNAPVAPQFLSDRMTAELPVDVFGRIMSTFEAWAKPLAFVGILLGQILVGGLIGLLVENALRRGLSPWLIIAGVTAGLWLVLAVIMAPLGGVGILASESNVESSTTALAFLATAIVYAAGVVTGVFSSLEGVADQTDTGRRRFLRWVTLGVPGVLAVVYLSRFMDGLAERSQPAAHSAEEGELPDKITPTEDFYTVSKNLSDPTVGVGDWVLTVEGEVESEIGFTYDDILEMDSVNQITTLECVSNPVGGPYISNAEWTGFPLSRVLEQAGIRESAADVVLHAEDDYSDSIPLDKAMDDNVMLVYLINGETLPSEHGYPLRLIVPGIYGMKHVKWINRIELRDYDYSGYWQERGWDEEAPIHTMSKITTPFYQSEVPIGERTLIGGVAFSGERGISRVELTLDGGETWFDATVEDPLSGTSWVRWYYDWTPEEETFAHIKARAYDADGTPQTEEPSEPLPDGSTGLHEIRVTATQLEEPEEDDESA